MRKRCLSLVLAVATATFFANAIHAELLSYEGFETGAEGYTAGANLPGQSYDGTGQASGGSWTGDDAADTTVSATGLKHWIASSGGKAVHSGNGGDGSRVNLDMGAEGPFVAAGLVDAGYIGGGNISGTIYVSFLTRSHYPSPGNEPRWAGLTVCRGNALVQTLGGNEDGAWAYSIFGATAKQDMKQNSGTGSYIQVDAVTRLFVAKITFNAAANDDLTVWCDPDPLNGDSQGVHVPMYAGTGVADFSFDNLRLRAGPDGAGDEWDFDEIRIGTSWADVTPPTTESISHEGFETGAGAYTAGADLPGQTLHGAGQAAGTWTGDNATDSTVTSGGLLGVVASTGAKATHNGDGGDGTRASLAVNGGGAFDMAGLLDPDSSTIGGGRVGGTMYVSFLTRSHSTSPEAEPRFAGLVLYRDTVEVQSCGGNAGGPWAYSIFGASGSGTQDLLQNGVGGTHLTVNKDTHLFVAKITFNPTGNDDLTVWLDPDPADRDNQSLNLRSWSGTSIGNLSFDNYRLRAGDNGAGDEWDFDEIRIGRTWESVAPPVEDTLLLYEPFATGVGHYTAGADLPGQSLDATGFASGGSWTADAADDATVDADGLTHNIVTAGGKTTHNGNTVYNNTGTRAMLDMSGGGVFDQANLVQGGVVGGGTIGGSLYISFLARSHGTSANEPRFAGLVTYRGGTRVQSLGGNGLGAHAYSTFGVFNADLLTNNVGGTYRYPQQETVLFVAKITFHGEANDDITVWADPVLADGENQGGMVHMRSGTSVGNLSFDSVELQAGPDGTNDEWDFDEIRIGTTWDSVTPSAASPGVLLSYEPFKDYANGDLAGQNYLGTGYAEGGSWSGGGAAAYSGVSLTIEGGLSRGGKAVHAGDGSNLQAYLDTSGAGPFGRAQLMDFGSGYIGGGNVSGTLYVSFLARAQFAASTDTEDTPFAGAYSSLQLMRGGVNAQALGGNHWTAWSYGIFGASGEVDFKDNGGAGAWLNYDTSTRHFVAKITFNPEAADDLTIWMDPNQRDGENQGSDIFMYSSSGVGDLAFNNYMVRAGNDPNDNGWDFDEIRFGTTFDSVMLPPAVGTLFIIK